MKRNHPDSMVIALMWLCLSTVAVAYFAPTQISVEDETENQPEARDSPSDQPSRAPKSERKRKSRDEYAELLQRPLFNATRRPVISVSAAEMVEVAPRRGISGDLELVGVVLADERQFALIRNPTTRETASVSVGEDISGWEVTDLSPDSATLQQGTASKILKLERKSDPRQAAKSRSESNLLRRGRVAPTRVAIQAASNSAGGNDEITAEGDEDRDAGDNENDVNKTSPNDE